MKLNTASDFAPPLKSSGGTIFFHGSARAASVTLKISETHGHCSVVDCTDSRTSSYLPPASENTRAEWINVKFHRNILASVGENLSHFVGTEH